MSFLPLSEFTERQRRVAEYLESRDLDAFVVTGADNIFYMSGFMLDVATWERPAACLVTRTRDAFAVLNELSTNHVRMAWERGSLAVEDVVHYTEHPRSARRTASVLDWTKLVRLGLARHGARAERLACDALESSVSPLAAGFGGTDWVQAGSLISDLRMVKSAAEVDVLRHAATLSDFGQDAYAALAREGMLASDLDHEVTRQVLSRAAETYPGSKVEVRCGTLAGPASASPHGTGAECGMRLDRGDVLVNIMIDGVQLHAAARRPGAFSRAWHLHLRARRLPPGRHGGRRCAA